MKKRVLAAAVAAAWLLAGTSAYAQYDDSDYVDYVSASYVSVLGGLTWDPALSFNGSRAAMEQGFNVGGRYGIQLGDVFPMSFGMFHSSGFAVELDAFYNQNHYSGTPSRLASASLMGDLIYRINTDMGFGIYGGGGIGVVQASFNGRGLHGTSAVMGWQVLGGVEYPIAQNTSLFAEYRYQDAHNVNFPFAKGVGNRSNNLSFGLKFNL